MRDLDHLNDKQEAIKHLIQAMRNVAILMHLHCAHHCVGRL